jgi:DNA-binding PadR family transcriptional regulator
MSDQAMGEFEHLVLLAIVRAGDRAHGATIRTLLDERAGKRASFGAIYSTLRRLEAKGWITSRKGPPSTDAEGRDRKYVEVTRAGIEALTATQRRLGRMSEGLELA